MKFGIGKLDKWNLWVFLKLHKKFLIISLSEDANLSYFKNIGSAELKYYCKKYE